MKNKIVTMFLTGILVVSTAVPIFAAAELSETRPRRERGQERAMQEAGVEGRRRVRCADGEEFCWETRQDRVDAWCEACLEYGERLGRRESVRGERRVRGERGACCN